VTETNEKARGLKDNEVGQSAVDGMVKPCAWTMQEMMDALPLTADGKVIIPVIDERRRKHG